MAAVATERRISDVASQPDDKILVSSDTPPIDLNKKNPNIPKAVVDKIIADDARPHDWYAPTPAIAMKEGVVYVLGRVRNAIRRTLTPPRGQQDWMEAIFQA